MTSNAENEKRGDDDEFSEMEFKRYLFGDESAVLTNEYLAASIEGARQFFLGGAPEI